MSIGKLCPSQLLKYGYFEIDGYQYWDAIPHSHDLTHPSVHLKFVDGILYQFWATKVNEKGGIWIKVPTISRPEVSDTDAKYPGLDLNVGDKVVEERLEKFPITVTDTTHKEKGLYFGWQQDVVYHDRINYNCRIDTRAYKFVKV